MRNLNFNFNFNPKFAPGDTSTATFNISILLAAASVAVAIIVLHFAANATSFIVHALAVLLVLVTAAYAVIELVRQGLAIMHDPEQVPAIGRSAILSSFVLSFVTISLSSTLAVGSIILGLVAAISLIAITLFSPTASIMAEPTLEPSRTTLPPPIRPLDLEPVAGSTVADTTRDMDPIASDRTTSSRKQTIDPATLAPLFVRDALYQLPQSRKALLLAVAKGNDHLVNSEDGCAISKDETCFALCDGANGSRLPRPWATLLAQHWTKKPFQETDAEELNQWLKEPRRRWQSWVETDWKNQVNERNKLIGDTPLASETIRRHLQIGASSTFLGLKLAQKTKQWYAVAIGDTCLFIFHRGKSGQPQLPECFPFYKSAQFKERPLLLSSTDSSVEPLIEHLACAEGEMTSGDIFMLTTSPLAQWLLTQIEQRQTEWQTLLSLRDQSQFAAFVAKQRQRPKGAMVNDDTTMVVIQ